MKSEAHRDNYPEIKEEVEDFHLLIKKLNSAIHRNSIKECKHLIPKFKYNWINYQDDNNGNTFLHLAAINNADLEICKLLIEKMTPIAINVQNDNKLTAYQEAKNREYTHICELLEDITLPGGK